MAGAPNPPMTPSQYKQYLHWLKTHHFTRSQRAAFNKAKRRQQQQKRVKGKHHAGHVQHGGGGKRGAPGLVPAGEWLSNGGDATCAATAVANSLLAATGIRAPQGEILRLHRLAGGDAGGAVISAVLDAAWDYGLCGVTPARISPGTGGGTVITGVGDHVVCERLGDVITYGVLLSGAQAGGDESWTIWWE